ncbi:MAG: hypothetical protein P8N47_02180 [Bacteroidia bacterium]|jgi:hypothetical protein|nr:hypothetical protein [Bacteroidia bacterium]
MSGKLIIQTAKILSVFIILAACGCEPEIMEYSDVPEIELMDVNVIQNVLLKDSIIQLTISFRDGDGDIGLTDADTTAPFNAGSPYAHNLPITFLVEGTNGEFKELINATTGRLYGNNHSRVPVITPTGKHKSITGEMVVKVTANPAAQNPTRVYLEIQLIDRALNTSNKIRTEVINLTH